MESLLIDTHNSILHYCCSGVPYLNIHMVHYTVSEHAQQHFLFSIIYTPFLSGVENKFEGPMCL